MRFNLIKILFSNAVNRLDKSLIFYRTSYIIIFIILLYIFIYVYGIDFSFLKYESYLITKLNPYNKINIILLLIINVIIFFLVNMYNIFIGALILLNTQFLFKDFFFKHKNYKFILKNVDTYKFICIFSTKIISIIPISVLFFYIYPLLHDNSYNLIYIYITQVPLAYINNISYQLFCFFINMNRFNYKIINNKLYTMKFRYIVDFSLYNNNVVHKVNLYSLLSRLIIIFVLSNTMIFFIIFVFILLILGCYNLVKFTNPTPAPSPLYIPIKSGINMSTATTLGLGTLIWSSINNSDTDNIDPTDNISIINHSNIENRTLFEVKYSKNTNISTENINLIRNSRILSILQRVNIDKEELYDESLEQDFISTNINDKTVMAYKKFNQQTSCAVIYRSDINSFDYYPSYYTNKEAVSNLNKFLYNKFLINSETTNDIIIFTQKIDIGNSLYKVWRMSPEYDSFLFKFEKNMAKPTYFDIPLEGTYKINPHNTHFDSLEVVNALNDCLDEKNKHFFSLESHYSGVYTEFLHYAKLPTHFLSSEHYIMGTKIDFIIRNKMGDYYNHTYIERKSPSEQENMAASRNQSLRYISIDKKWAEDIKSVYGINCIGLNMEFNEYCIGNKGLLIIENNYKNIINKDLEIYSIISETDPINIQVKYSFNVGNRVVKGIADFRLYKEYASLDNHIDSDFINKCRMYQLT